MSIDAEERRQRRMWIRDRVYSAGRNGKGFTNEFLQIVLGDYYESVSPTIFSEDQENKTSSGANPEIAKLDKKR